MSASLNKILGIGCGDNSCVWGPPGGQGTNGGCQCENVGRPTFSLSTEQMKERMLLRGGIRLLRDLAQLPEVERALKEIVSKIEEGL